MRRSSLVLAFLLVMAIVIIPPLFLGPALREQQAAAAARRAAGDSGGTVPYVPPTLPGSGIPGSTMPSSVAMSESLLALGRAPHAEPAMQVLAGYEPLLERCATDPLALHATLGHSAPEAVGVEIDDAALRVTAADDTLGRRLYLFHRDLGALTLSESRAAWTDTSSITLPRLAIQRTGQTEVAITILGCPGEAGRLAALGDRLTVASGSLPW